MCVPPRLGDGASAASKEANSSRHSFCAVIRMSSLGTQANTGAFPLRLALGPPGGLASAPDKSASLC